MSCRLGEEGVIELYDALLGAEVAVEGLRAHLIVGEPVVAFGCLRGIGVVGIGEAVYELPVAVAPPVDALLHVAHYQRVAVELAEAVAEEHLEVVPLHGTGVLELVNHYVAEPGSDLLEDEWCVLVLYESVEQHLGLAQREPAGIVVQTVHGLADGAEEAQLGEMAEREPCALVAVPFRVARLLHALKGSAQTVPCQGDDVGGMGGALLRPALRVVDGLLHAAARGRAVEGAAGNLAYGHQDASLVAVGEELRVVKPVAVEDGEDALRRIGDGFLRRITLADELRREGLEELGVVELAVYVLTVLLVEIAEDIVSEFLYLSNDIPALVVVYVGIDVLANPFQLLTFGIEALYHLVDGLLLHVLVVEAHAETVGEVELMGEVPEHALEEGVDGLDVEVMIVVHEQVQGLAGALPDDTLVADAGLLPHGGKIGLRALAVVGNAVELREYAELHLCRSLVGEGNGEYLAEGVGLADQKAYVLHGQGEGLSRACRCLVDGQWERWGGTAAGGFLTIRML